MGIEIYENFVEDEVAQLSFGSLWQY